MLEHKRTFATMFEDQLLRWAYVMGAEIEEAWDFVTWTEKNLATLPQPLNKPEIWSMFLGETELPAMV